MKRSFENLLVSCAIVLALVLSAPLAAQAPATSAPRESAARFDAVWKETRRLDSQLYATQAAAADDRFVYGISNPAVAKLDRATGELVQLSEGKATHLNAGLFLDGKLYLAESNYPAKPETSQVMVLDPETMKLATVRNFGDSDGSLVWLLRHEDHWWANFAFYKEEMAQSYLAKFDDEWNELRRWTYPQALLEQLHEASLSGGVWRDGALLATGHDDKVLFRLGIPEDGKTLTYRGRESVPFTGQGFADDPVTNGLIGIDRAKRQIVFAGRIKD